MSALREQSIGPGLEPELYKEFRLFGTVGKALSTQLYLPGGQKEPTGRDSPGLGSASKAPKGATLSPPVTLLTQLSRPPRGSRMSQL